MDIHDFFGSIQWRQVEQVLKTAIVEDDVLYLIRQNACGLSLDEESGELSEKKNGIFQGSGIAPILSNIYLMDFDHWLTYRDDVYFMRYSDDMIVLGKDGESMKSLLQEMAIRLEHCGLSINEKKSSTGRIEDGMNFLGYAFNTEGKFIPKKAEESLKDRLEMMWLTGSDIGIEDKLKKVLEIVGGWEQYFRDEREISTVFEYAALVFGGSDDNREKLKSLRPSIDNIYRDITLYLAEIWKTEGEQSLELLEYEQYYMVPGKAFSSISDAQAAYVNDLLKGYRHYFIRESEEEALNIVQAYTDLAQYEKAEYWQEKATKLKEKNDRLLDVAPLMERTGERDIIYKSDTAARFLRMFSGREDILYTGDSDIQQR